MGKEIKQMSQKLSKCCHAPVDDLIEVDQSWSTICRKCQHRCEVEEPTQGELPNIAKASSGIVDFNQHITIGDKFDWTELQRAIDQALVDELCPVSFREAIIPFVVPREAWELEKSENDLWNSIAGETVKDHIRYKAKCKELQSKLSAANQEIVLLKGKLDRLRQAIIDAGLFEPDCDLNNNVVILTPSPKEEKK